MTSNKPTENSKLFLRRNKLRRMEREQLARRQQPRPPESEADDLITAETAIRGLLLDDEPSPTEDFGEAALEREMRQPWKRR